MINPICNWGNGIKSSIQYVLYCSNFPNERSIFIKNIWNINETILEIIDYRISEALVVDDNSTLEYIVYSRSIDLSFDNSWKYLCNQNRFYLNSHLDYSRVSNRRGGQSKRGGWQISAKIIIREGAINGKIDKNLQS